MTKPTPIQVTEKRVSCNGGGGALGHPKVFYEFKPGETQLTCAYCGQVFEWVAA